MDAQLAMIAGLAEICASVALEVYGPEDWGDSRLADDLRGLAIALRENGRELEPPVVEVLARFEAETRIAPGAASRSS
jgi:hypothetical protein